MSNSASTLAPETSEQKLAGAPATDCPYPGLRAFFTEERNWYFGREEHVDAMLSRLESNRFLAVVGSSGSGKSSLVFAGLIPALREGQLAGSRRNADGDAAPWTVIDFHPGNDPLEELASAILRAAAKPDDPHLAGYIRAALDGGEQGLMEALSVAGCLDAGFETLLYADQFEELFRFGERTGRAAQENALQFARLFVVAAQQKQVRLHVLLSMRSEFIGECERFPGLPEIVSASQFLTPRLSRRQMEQSLSCPAEAAGGKIEPDALTAILNDCGISPDPLPLAQHVLRRMWKRASLKFASRLKEGGGRLLTLEGYKAVGGIEDSLAQHGDEILGTLPQPDGTEVARLLFMSMCEQREEGPLVRRLSSRSEVEAIAAEKATLVPTVIAAFGTDDPGFIREDKGWLDVRHEAILRQWPLISDWRKREIKAEAWLHDLAQSAKDYEEDPTTELWRGNDLRGAGEWMHREKPTKAWAARHGVNNWDQCLHFLELSRKAESDSLREKRISLRMAREEKERRQRIWLGVTGGIALLFLIAGLFMAKLWKNAKQSEIRSTSVISAFAKTADELAPPIDSNAKSALAEAEQQTEKLTKALLTAGVASPPDRATIDDLVSTREMAEGATGAMEKIANSMKEVALITNDTRLNANSAELGREAAQLRDRRKALLRSPEAFKAIEAAFEMRLKEAENDLTGLDADRLDTNLVKVKKEKEIPAATASLSAIEAIGAAADALGFEAKDFQQFQGRFKALFNTLDAIQKLSLDAGTTLTTWQPNTARALIHAGKVNSVRFLTGSGGSPLIVSAGEDKMVTLWSEGGKQLGRAAISSAINDIAVSTKAMAIAAASNGSTVRILRWANLPNFDNIKIDAFERHSDSVTDIEFSHGGERVASGSADRTVRVFDSRTLAQLYFTSPPLPGIVTSVAFHRGDNLVVSACDDGGVRLHTIDKPSVQLLGEKMGAPARRPEFSADGKLVIAASGDKTARIWTIDPPREIVNWSHPAPVTQATFRPIQDSEGYTFVSCATNGEVRYVQVGNKPATNPTLDRTVNENVLEPRHPGAVLSAAWSTDGRWLATVGGGEVLVWDWATGFPIARLRLSGLHKDTSRAEFSENAALLVTYGGDNTAHVWDLTKIP
jgi:WD40 repeat protein/energy-coupling factor transporter ATP-binding protein EcfA2